MKVMRGGLAAALWLAILAAQAHAADCVAAVDALHAVVAQRIDSVAGRGPDAVESRRATMGYQPTPSSVARAEQGLGEGGDLLAVLDLLASARREGVAGDADRCRALLEDARARLARP